VWLFSKIIAISMVEFNVPQESGDKTSRIQWLTDHVSILIIIIIIIGTFTERHICLQQATEAPAKIKSLELKM